MHHYSNLHRDNNTLYPFAPADENISSSNSIISPHSENLANCCNCKDRAETASSASINAIERYRYNQMKADSGDNLGMIPKNKDSRQLIKDIQDWKTYIFAEKEWFLLNNKEQALYKTVQEILSQDSQYVLLTQKYEDILHILSLWIKETYQDTDSVTEDSPQYLRDYQKVVQKSATTPNNWLEFLYLLKEEKSQSQVSQEKEFYQSLAANKGTSYKDVYEEIAGKLRKKELSHSRIESTKTDITKNHNAKEDNISEKVTQEVNTPDVYETIAKMLRSYEKTQNQIL